MAARTLTPESEAFDPLWGRALRAQREGATSLAVAPGELLQVRNYLRTLTEEIHQMAEIVRVATATRKSR